MARRTRARRAAAPQIEETLASDGARIKLTPRSPTPPTRRPRDGVDLSSLDLARTPAPAAPGSPVDSRLQVDRITLLAMGLRMRAVCAELRTLPRFAPKFWGVAWDKRKRRWAARYRDADGKTRTIGYFDDQEEAAHAVNAAIRRAGLEGRRRTNPVDADGRVVPHA